MRVRGGRPRPTGASGIRSLRPWLTWALVVALVLILAGCARAAGAPPIGGDAVEFPQDALQPAPDSPAQLQDALWNLVAPIALAVFILVQGLILFAVWRYRDRGEDPDKLPKQVAGNTRLEIMWTLIPALILAGIAIPTVSTIFQLSGTPEDALNVRVIAKQYWWEFEYEDPEYDGLVTATELRIPTGRSVVLNMQSVSPTDSYNPAELPEGQLQPRGNVARGVIHSFWVPRLAGKHDVVPGHTRTMQISTSEPGKYLGQCGEYCGLSHANMKFYVIAQPPEEFEAWAAERMEPAALAEEGLAEQGQQLFVDKTCVACHNIDGHPQNGGARVGPDLTHFWSRDVIASYLPDTEEQLAAWLRNPQAEKPGAQMPNLNLTDEEVEALVAYLQTLE